MTPQVEYSIIVPVYNIEKHIRRCLDSIISQTISDFELLLIDDGSKDKSGAICDEYAVRDNRIKVFHKTNGGVSSARNMGLDNSTGKYVIFIDSDDWIEPDFISKLSSGLDADMSVCTYILENSNDIGHPVIRDGLHDRADIKLLLERGLIMEAQFSAPWCKIFKRSIIEAYNIRFNKNITIGEDTIFVLQYLSHIENLYYIHRKLYHCWHSDSSLSSYGHSSENFFNFEKDLSNISLLMGPAYNIDVIKFKATILSNILGNYIQTYRSLQNRAERIKRVKKLRSVNDIGRIYHVLYANGPSGIVASWLFKYRLYYLFDLFFCRNNR